MCVCVCEDECVCVMVCVSVCVCAQIRWICGGSLNYKLTKSADLEKISKFSEKRTEKRGREDGGQRMEDRGWRTEDWRTEDWRTEDWRTEDSGREDERCFVRFSLVITQELGHLGFSSVMIIISLSFVNFINI